MRIDIQGSASIGWLHQNAGLVCDETYYFDPEVRNQRCLAMQDFCAKQFPDYEINFFEGNLVESVHWVRNQMVVGAIQPNMLLGAAVGAKFVFSGVRDPDIEMTPLKDLDSDGLARLREIDWANTYPFKVFLDQIDELKNRYGTSRPIIPPFFWDRSGRATIHGPITTAQKLMGERFYIEMIENESFAREFLDWIADSYIALCRLFSERAGLPITSLHIGECSACLLGPEQFQSMPLESIQKLIDALGPGRVHSCGLSDHLLEGFAAIRNLVCVNTGSRTSVAKVREIFGPDILVEIAPDAQLCCFGKPEEMKQFIDQSVAENGDGPLAIRYHFDQGYPQANCEALHERLIELGLIKRGRRHRPDRVEVLSS